MNFRLILLFIVLAVASLNVSAQLCNGSLGDPIVNITFGAGANPGRPLAAATTSYNFLNNDCPNDGQYTIRSSTNSCFGNTWHILNRDHTGDANGYFMLVNASFQPGDFYLDTVENLCSNTTYEFASWIMNVIKPTSCNGNTIAPNITFSIERLDGSVIKSFSSGNIPATATPAWKAYGSFFTTPPGISTVVVRMRNDAPGGCGNDLALDDITFRPCGPTLIPSITGIQNKTITICQGKDTSLLLSCNVSAGFNNPVFQWQQSSDGNTWTNIPTANATNLQVNVLTAAVSSKMYRLTVAEALNAGVSSCTIASDPLTVRVVANPITTAMNTGPVCSGDPLQLLASGGTSYSWTGPNGFSGSGASVTLPAVSTSSVGKYLVKVSNIEGCSSLDSTTVVLSPSPKATLSFTDTAICAGRPVQLFAFGGGNYQWQPASDLSSTVIQNPVAAPNDSAVYQVIVANSAGCRDSALVRVNIIPHPTANAGPDQLTSEDQQVVLQGSATGHNLLVRWAPQPYVSNPGILQPRALSPRDTSFILTVTSGDGCGLARDTMRLKVYKNIDIPNVFSPNGDGINDVWQIPALQAYPAHQVTIFDRYGRVLFNDKKFKGWDGTVNGKPLAIGTYYFVIDGKDFLRLSGSVLLIK